MIKRGSNKIKKGAWFVKIRGSYIPVSWQGWLTYVPFIGFLVSVLSVAFRTQNSASDIFYMVFPQWVASAVVMTWIASRHS
ncbi:MAG: hypothetical protein WCJ86_03290 [Candidatus Saccharibacteria bacterium]